MGAAHSKGRGRFITLEGSEGTGKSTNVSVICRCLDEAGISYYQTREPGGTPLAEALRGNLLQRWAEPVDGLTELLIVFAARNQHLCNEIRPRLASGQWVVCDRFTDATFAYQGAGRGVEEGSISQLEEWVQQGLQPDLTIYLDMDPELAEQRLAGRMKDRLELEQKQFFAAVRRGYQRRAQQHKRMHTVDAAQPLAQVQQQVAALVQDFIQRSGG